MDRIKSIIVFLILFFFVFNHNAQDIGNILDRHYQAAGAKDKWDNIESAVMHYRNVSYDNWPNRKGPAELSTGFKVNKRLNGKILERFISFYERDTFSTCYDGKTYWRQASGMPLQRFDDYSDHYGQYVQIGNTMLLSKSDSIHDMGRTELVYANGVTTKCHLIAVYFDGTATFFFINPETWLLDASTHGRSMNGPITFYSDYEEIEGLMFPLKETIQKDGLIISETQFLSIRLNAELPEYLFYEQTDFSTIIKLISQN